MTRVFGIPGSRRRLKRGEVLLLPFPFADAAATKVRPGLVMSSALYHGTGSDVIVAAMTSNVESRRSFDVLLQDWRQAGLYAPTVVKATLATISSSFVRHRLGRVSRRDLENVSQALRRALAL